MDGVAIRDARFGGSAGVVMGRLRHDALIDQSTFRVLGGMRFSHFAHVPIDGGVSGESRCSRLTRSRFPIGADAEAVPFFQSRLRPRWLCFSFSASAFHATPRHGRQGLGLPTDAPDARSGPAHGSPLIHTGESWGKGDDGVVRVFLHSRACFARSGASVPYPNNVTPLLYPPSVVPPARVAESMQLLGCLFLCGPREMTLLRSNVGFVLWASRAPTCSVHGMHISLGVSSPMFGGVP